MHCPIPTKEYKEHERILGKDVALYYWNANNGHPLNLDKNGLQSELFDRLYSIFPYDEAYRQTSKFYSVEFLESNPEFNQEQINQDEIEWLDEDGNPCAAEGLTDTIEGTNWKIVEKFEGPSHEHGGIDIQIEDGKMHYTNGKTKFHAKYGLLISKNYGIKK